MDPLPLINKVFSYATQEERQLNGTVSMNNLSLINAANASHPRNLCSYCGKNGHAVEVAGKRMAIQVIFHRIEEEEVELFMVMVEAGILTEAVKCAITVVSLATLRQSASRNKDIHQDIVCTRHPMLISMTQLQNQRIMRIQQQQQLQFRKDRIQK